MVETHWSAHNLIFMTCFALTIYGWKWACGGRTSMQIHLRTFPGGLWFIQWTLRSGVRVHGFINLIFLLHTPYPAFVHMYTFSMNTTHCFINETPGPHWTHGWWVGCAGFPTTTLKGSGEWAKFGMNEHSSVICGTFQKTHQCDWKVTMKEGWQRNCNDLTWNNRKRAPLLFSLRLVLLTSVSSFTKKVHSHPPVYSKEIQWECSNKLTLCSTKLQTDRLTTG